MARKKAYTAESGGDGATRGAAQSSRETHYEENASSVTSGYLILDIDDKEVLLKLSAGRKVILTGRAVKFFEDVKKVAEDIILCEECSDGVQYSRKITYYGQAQLLREGDAQVIVSVDKASLHKVITYLNILALGTQEGTQLGTEFGTEIGELWCSEKHLEMALVAVVEVIEKAIRAGMLIDELIEVHKGIREVLEDFNRLCITKDFNLTCELIDKIRRLRAKAGLWRVRNRANASAAILEDFRKITGNLAHAEDHLVQFLAQLKLQDKCITCVEDQQT